MRNARQELARCDRPTPREKILWVERLKGTDRQKFVVYSRALLGYCTHWNGARTVPCWADTSLCEGGHNEETKRENFLLHCWSFKKQKQVFAYLTPGAAEDLLAQVPPSDSLRGRIIVLTRSARDKGRLSVEIEHDCHDKDRIPPELDPYHSILAFLKAQAPGGSAQILAGTGRPGENRVFGRNGHVDTKTTA